MKYTSFIFGLQIKRSFRLILCLNSGSPHGSDEEGSEIIIPEMFNYIAANGEECWIYRGASQKYLTIYAVNGGDPMELKRFAEIEAEKKSS